ncbi:unnamed protein product, partial [Mesorhabditis belari]|uniref:Uncharacterized protein n=1 Tax=Mesorhabditis belari TaxID=2138241 RepID=A0AAF3EA95_9BILA
MNQYSYSTQDHRSSTQSGGSSQQGQNFNSYSTFHPTTTYTSSSTLPYTSNTFIPSNGQSQAPEIRLVNAAGEPTEQRYVQLNPSGQDDKIASLLDSYFLEQPQQQSWTPQQSSTGGQIAYSQGMISKNQINKPVSQEKLDKEKAKRIKQAEAARLRYHRLSNEEKRELNLKRTQAQKRKRQREKEMEQLEEILRQSNDIQEDPDITEQLREKRLRAKWAEAARARYQRMTPDERRNHNNRRRMRQMQHALHQAKEHGELTGDPLKDEDAIKRQIKAMNAKKAEAARQRYHRMTEEEKRVYNQRRTEAFRRRRMEEEMLLAMPIGRINGEALDRAQQIVVRNAKRAEAARLRYQRMTPEQRKQYNQKRYTPKRTKGGSVDGSNGLGSQKKQGQQFDENYDVLSSIERDVLKRTQQAQQVLLRQQRAAQINGGPGPSTPTYVIASQGSSVPAQGQVVQQIVQNGQVVHQVQSPAVVQVQVPSTVSGGHQITHTVVKTQTQGSQSSQGAPSQIHRQPGQQPTYQHHQIISNPYGGGRQ